MGETVESVRRILQFYMTAHKIDYRKVTKKKLLILFFLKLSEN